MSEYKLGLATASRCEIDQLDQMNAIKAAGFDAFFTVWLPERTEEIANHAARIGLVQQSIHSPFGGERKVRYMWEGGEAGDFVTQGLIDCVNDCARFDIPVMVIHPFIGFEDHTPTQVGLDNYARVIEAANKRNVTLGFENVEGEEYLEALMKTFWNEPCLGFCLDTGHEMCYNEHRDMLAKYGEKLCHTHFNDNLGVRGDDITFYDDLHLMPGDGIADWHGIMERIRKTGYNGILMSELSYKNNVGRDGVTLNYGDMPYEEYVALAYRKVKEAIQA